MVVRKDASGRERKEVRDIDEIVGVNGVFIMSP